jgi:tetratricopeptide (TPR) repeat protein
MRRLLLPLLVLLLLPWAAGADQKDPALDTLFQQLKAATNPEDARRTEQQIWHIWLDLEDDDGRLLLNRGLVYMSFEQYDQALAAFTQVVERLPDFAEGWNKRATVYFLMDRYDESVADIEKTLALEPRHFGALSGLGIILQEMGDDKHALDAFRRALAIHPHLERVPELVKKLSEKIDGRDI